MTTSTKINICTVTLIGLFMFIADKYDLGFLLWIIFVTTYGIFLMFLKCKNCDHHLTFGKYTCGPYVYRKCPRCGIYDPLGHKRKFRETRLQEMAKK